MPNFYQLQMLRIPSRYGLGDDALRLLKAYDDFKRYTNDETELGRLIRLSPNTRARLNELMVKLAKIMGKKSEETRYCLDLIEACAEMVRIADRPPMVTGFPFFRKLPLEVRNRVYDYYVGFDPVVSIRGKKGTCACAPPEAIQGEFRPVNLALAYTCKQMKEEVLAHFYEKKIIYFSCACEMGWRLRNQSMMKECMRKVKFHWCGAEADQGIRALGDCRIEELDVTISRVTGQSVTPRERRLSQFFIRNKNKGDTQFPDILGFDELSALRGISTVVVTHCHKRQASNRSQYDRQSLFLYLVATVKQPRVKSSD